MSVYKVHYRYKEPTALSIITNMSFFERTKVAFRLLDYYDVSLALYEAETRYKLDVIDINIIE